MRHDAARGRGVSRLGAEAAVAAATQQQRRQQGRGHHGQEHPDPHCGLASLLLADDFLQLLSSCMGVEGVDETEQQEQQPAPPARPPPATHLLPLRLPPQLSVAASPVAAAAPYAPQREAEQAHGAEAPQQAPGSDAVALDPAAIEHLAALAPLLLGYGAGAPPHPPRAPPPAAAAAAAERPAVAAGGRAGVAAPSEEGAGFEMGPSELRLILELLGACGAEALDAA
jgi:hypothetical protein